MPTGSSGETSPRNDRQRFALPEDDVAPGRSQPKRTPPPRRDANSQLLRRIAWGVATFGISLTVVSFGYGLLFSPAFQGVSFENGTTAAIALLIGCFTLPAAQRTALNPQQHLLTCFVVLAITPWTYQLGNRLEDSGMDLATGFNFIFEVLSAVVAYRLVARRTIAQATA